ncbi:MAG: hypothetical protein GC172_04010 [Phycisphaera sp.]|nr:hypothetical protein [Phycisphaera sp.]
MNTLDDTRKKTLALGLAAFDAAARRRRLIRRATQGAAVAVLVLACAAVAGRALRSEAPRLPAYVELIPNDAQLTGELELANACERIDRNDGLLLVIECARPPASGS